ncbi:E3 ubiquitin-protein ligase RGLG3 [Glycine soja]
MNMPVIMGNSESMYESQDNFYQHPPSYNNSYHQPSPYAENSENNTYHEPSSYAGTSSNTSYYQPSTHPGSSANTRHQYIADNFGSLDQKLVWNLQIEYLVSTSPKAMSGQHSFHRKSLHHIGNIPNPYEQAISIIGHTLSSFDEDNLIPCFGFGDASTHDQNVFSFYRDNRFCHGFEEVLARYREIGPYIKLSELFDSRCFRIYFLYRLSNFLFQVFSVNFENFFFIRLAKAPSKVMIFAWMVGEKRTLRTIRWFGVVLLQFECGAFGWREITKSLAGDLFLPILVTRNPDVPRGKLSPQAQATISSIAAASHYPLSIILVGVGDGPWDEMKHFDDNISERLFDNFQLEIRRIGVWRDIDKLDSTSSNSETNIRGLNKNVKTLFKFLKVLKNEYRVFKMSINTGNFSAAALMEIPFQYRAAQNIQLNDRESVLHQHKRPFPPPNEAIDHDNARMAIPHMTNLESAEPTAPAAVEPVCPICLTNPKDMAFGCGHTTCKECGSTLSSCPMCRQQITTPPRLYT